MLLRLEFAGLVPLEASVLEPGPGLTVLTGESGVGKSVLVDVLGVFLGGKLPAGLVEPEGFLATLFSSEQVLSRRIGGKSLARIDGEVVSTGELNQTAAGLLAIHAQHAALALSRPRAGLEVLDRLVPTPVRSQYTQAYVRQQAQKRDLEALEAQITQVKGNLEAASGALKEIQAAGIWLSEEEQLLEEKNRLMHAERLRDKGGAAAGYLQQISLQLTQAIRELTGAAAIDASLGPLAQELQASETGLAAVERELEIYLESLSSDPARLETVHNRLTQLRTLTLKYGSLEAALELAEQLKERLSQAQGLEARQTQSLSKLNQAQAELAQAAQALSAARVQAAQKLSAELTREVRALGLPAAELKFQISQLPHPGPLGAEEASLRFRAGPNLSWAPLDKAASGGELSRIMLAIALITGAEAPSVVFDEIDAGIGGETAWVVADRLARLAKNRQVLVVTHLAQIAALAGVHYRVEKSGTKARLVRLEGEERVREIARMLSGTYSEVSIQHARELLARTWKSV